MYDLNLIKKRQITFFAHHGMRCYFISGHEYLDKILLNFE